MTKETDAIFFKCTPVQRVKIINDTIQAILQDILMDGDTVLLQATWVHKTLSSIQSRVNDILPTSLSEESRTQRLVYSFAEALLEKLQKADKKYQYGESWMEDGWEKKLQADLMRHVFKGDPLDVAAYCAFAWHHAWSTDPTVSTIHGESTVDYLLRIFETEMKPLLMRERFNTLDIERLNSYLYYMAAAEKAPARPKMEKVALGDGGEITEVETGYKILPDVVEPLDEDNLQDIAAMVQAGEAQVPRVEDMTREELIETIRAMEAHHQEHHGYIKAYEPSEVRVANYIGKATNNAIGGGEDPVGFLIASHQEQVGRLQFLQKNNGIRTFTAFRPDVAKHGKHNDDQMNPPDVPQFQGVVFSDGTCCLRWMTNKASTSVWNDLRTMLDIHGHSEYGTYFIWDDGTKQKYMGGGLFESID